MRNYLVIASFLLLPACSAADGGQGPAGPAGADGDSGVDGDPGADGADGTDGAPGEQGASALINIDDEPAGANCPNGGTKVETGIDLNGNGVLDDDEVQSSAYVCAGVDGADGISELTEVSVEAAGANCADGGMRIDNGADDNQNSILEAGEIEVTEYVCDGADGSDGIDGMDTLVATTAEPVGINCANAGVRIDSGSDTNDNGALDTAETVATSYVCNGAPAASNIAPTNAYNAGGFNLTTGASATALTGSITTPGSGTVMVIGSAELFCYVSLTTPQCADGQAHGYVTLSDSPTASASSGNYSFFYLNGDTSNSWTRTAIFDVDGAGTFNAYIRARDSNDDFGLWRRQLTMLYIPH